MTKAVPPALRYVVDRTPAWLRPGVELLGRTVVDALDDRIPGLAAEMAFYLILSLPPLLVTIFAGTAMSQVVLGVDVLGGASEQTRQVTEQFLTADASREVVTLVGNVEQRVTERAGTLLSFGLLLTLLSASRALRVTTVAITIAYDLADTRPTWQQFVYGFGFTLLAVVLGVVLVPALVVGPELGALLVSVFRLPEAVASWWRMAYWPGAVVIATLLLATLFHVAAPWQTPWRRDMPGAALSMLLGLAGSSLLRTYTSGAVEEDLFGALATPLVLLLWLYVMSFSVLFGAEFNAEIERMWPTTTPPPGDPAAAVPGTPAPN